MAPIRSLFALAAVVTVALLVVAQPADAADSPLSISPAEFDFGTMNVGGESTWTGEFTVTNNGAADVTLGLASIDEPAPWSFRILFDYCAFETLGQGQQCLLILGFDPAVAGHLTANLVVNSDAPGAAPTAALSGTALPELLPGFAATPADGDFGAVPVGTTSQPMAFEVEDTGQGDLRIGQVVVAGPKHDEFAITGEHCSNITMASGSKCRIEATFTPADLGPSDAFISIPTNAKGAETWIDLSGVGAKLVQTPTGVAEIEVARRLPRTDGRSLKLPVTCSTTNVERCAGKVRVQRRGRDGWLPAASGNYSVAEGKRSLSLKLNRAARRAIGNRGRLGLRIQMTVEQPNVPGKFIQVRRQVKSAR